MGESLEQLLVEIQVHIFSFLSFRDLLALSIVSQQLYVIANQGNLWKQICRNCWPEEWKENHSAPKGLPGFDWKKYCKQKIFLSKSDSFKWFLPAEVGSRPSQRCQQTGTSVQEANKIFYIGGQLHDQQRHNQIFSYDTAKSTWNEEELKGTMPRMSKHSAVYINKLIYVYGGYDGDSEMFQLQIYDPMNHTWRRENGTTGDIPPPNTNHAATAVGKYMYIYGGLIHNTGDDTPSFTDKLWEYDTEKKIWIIPKVKGKLPEPRCAHKLHAIGNKLYLFGGGIGSKWECKYRNMFVYDTIAKEWSQPSCTGCSVDISTYTSSFTLGPFMFLMFGGKYDQDSVSNDIYCFDAVTNHWTKIQPEGVAPPGRDQATANRIRNKVYCLHGYRGWSISDFSGVEMSKELYASFEEEELDESDQLAPMILDPTP